MQNSQQAQKISGIAEVITAPQLNQIHQAIAGLSTTQLHWVSGYLTGLSGGLDISTPANTPAHDPKVTLLYATQSGNAKQVAEALADRLAGAGLGHQLLSADEFKPRHLAKVQTLVVVISTQGEGESPESAHELFRYLKSEIPPDLKHLRYAIFGLGDSSYTYFCQAAKDLESLLTNAGANAVIPRIDNDIDYLSHTKTWYDSIIDTVANEHPDTDADIIPLQSHRPPVIIHNQAHPYPAILLERRPITTADAQSEVFHLNLQIDPATVHYQPGDAIGLYFENAQELVNEILERLNLDGDALIDFQGEILPLGTLLQSKLEITQLHPRVLKSLSRWESSGRLAEKAKNDNWIHNYCNCHQLIQLLRAYSIQPDARTLVASLQPINPRLYSIASSPLESDDELHLTIATRRYQAEGETHLGGASGFLNHRAQVQQPIAIYPVENKTFRLPADPQQPIIMIATGTGIAPFRAFLQQREQQGVKCRSWLLFGNRHFHRDYLYQRELLGWRKSSILERLDVAFSRDTPHPRYVQDLMIESADELLQWIDNGALLYVCGSLRMEKGVRDALHTILQSHLNLSAQEAKKRINDLQSEGRYKRDVY